jgi:hypothetical protein
VQNILVHFHIYKNAGTTIDWILQKTFGKNAQNVDDFDNPGRIIDWNVILDFLKANPDSESISSHQIRFPLPISDFFNFLPMVFIRDPLSRIFSIYGDQKRIGSNHELSIKAKTLSPKEFFEWCFNSTNKIMENSQTIFLQPNTPTQSPLEYAKKMILECSIIGITEKLDKSLVLAEEVLRRIFPKIDLSYVKQNVNPNNQTKKPIIEKSYNLLGETLTNELISRNKLDLELYSFTLRRLDFMLSKLDNFESKLDNFKERCKILSKNPPDIRIRNEKGINYIKNHYYGI